MATTPPSLDPPATTADYPPSPGHGSATLSTAGSDAEPGQVPREYPPTTAIDSFPPPPTTGSPPPLPPATAFAYSYGGQTYTATPMGTSVYYPTSMIPPGYIPPLPPTSAVQSATAGPVPLYSVAPYVPVPGSSTVPVGYPQPRVSFTSPVSYAFPQWPTMSVTQPAGYAQSYPSQSHVTTSFVGPAVPNSGYRRVWQLKSSAPAFAGTTRDTAAAKRFLRNVETYFLVNILDPTDYLAAVNAALIDKASDWYAGLALSLEGPVASWDDFKHRFLVRFSSHADEQEALDGLSSIKQRDDESVDEYQQRFEELAALIHNAQPSILLQWFVRGLRFDLMSHVEGMSSLRASGTLVHWLDAARSAEFRLRQLGRLDQDLHRVKWRKFDAQPHDKSKPKPKPRHTSTSLRVSDTSTSSKPAATTAPSSPKKTPSNPKKTGNAATDAKRAPAASTSQLPPVRFKRGEEDFVQPQGQAREDLLSQHLCFRCHQPDHPWWRCPADKPVNPLQGGAKGR